MMIPYVGIKNLLSKLGFSFNQEQVSLLSKITVTAPIKKAPNLKKLN